MHQAEVLSLVEGLRAKHETALEESEERSEDGSLGLEDFLLGGLVRKRRLITVFDRHVYILYSRNLLQIRLYEGAGLC